jgi:hypothetical protein
MKVGRAFVAGVIGGAVMSLLMAIGRAIGMPVNLEMILGTVTGMEPGVAAWTLGFVVHLVISGAIALLYGIGFEHVAHRAGAMPGILFSLLHIVIGGLALGSIPRIHPLVTEEGMSAPGLFMSNLGDAGVLAFFVLHAAYGAIVGTLYGPVLHPTTRRDRIEGRWGRTATA